MILKYSTPKGTPYIEFDDGSSFAFPLMMEDPQRGWKWMVFSGMSTESICVSGKNTKAKKYLETSEHIGFVTDLSLSTLDKRVKGKNGPLSPITLGILKKMLGEMAPDGWLSRESLVRLEDKLNSINNGDEIDEDITIEGDDEDDDD